MLDRLVARAARLPAYGELRWHANHSLRIMMRKGVLLANGGSRDSGLSARLYGGGAFGFAAAPADDEAALDAVIAAAADNAEFAGGGATGPLATAAGSGIFDYRSARAPLSAQERVEIVRGLDAAIRARYPGLLNVDVALTSHASEKILANSDGAATRSFVPRASLVVSMSFSANDGVVELYDVLGGFGEIEDQAFDAQTLAPFLEELYENLRRKAEGGHCEAGDHDVVLDSALAGILAHEAIGHTCEADLVLAGSVAGDRLGELVASEKITLGDYAGRGPDGESTFAIHVDDEGTPCRDVTIIDKGVLTNFLHSKRTAATLGAEPAGNARAFSFQDEPLVRMRNTAILPGDDKLADMIGAIERGYYLKRSTNGQADATSEFMFGVSCGYEIRDGRLGRAIRDTTISGVAFDMLKTVTHVGDDFHWSGAGGWCGKKQVISVGMGGPSIKCRVTLGGRG